MFSTTPKDAKKAGIKKNDRGLGDKWDIFVFYVHTALNKILTMLLNKLIFLLSKPNIFG